MPTSYHVDIITGGDLLRNPEIIGTINKIFYDSGWDDSPNYLGKLYNHEAKHTPQYTAIYYKNHKAVGVRTLLVKGNQSTILIENGCIVNPRESDYANFLKLLLYELVYGEYPITGLMDALCENRQADYYFVAYVNENNFYSKGISTMCKIDDIGFVCNYLTKKGGYESSSFPGLKMDWSDFKQAFVVRVCKGEIVKRPSLKYVPEDCKNLLQSPVNSSKSRNNKYVTPSDSRLKKK